MIDQDDVPTRPVATVTERRASKREVVRDPHQPTKREVQAAIDALDFYGLKLGPFEADAVRRMLVAASLQREREDGDEEVRARVEAHLTEAK